MTTQPKEITKTAGDYIAEAVSAVLSTVPFTGGLATYLNAYYPDQVRRNIDEFRQTLVDHANSIDHINCNLERLGSLVSEVILEIPKTSSEAKRRAFRSLLLNYASGKQIGSDELDVYVSLLSSMTELQLRMLQVSQEPQSEAARLNLFDPGQLAGWVHVDITQIIPNTDESILHLAYNDLCQKLLLDGPSSVGSALGSPIRLGSLRLSALGRRFIDWIRR